MCVPSISQEKTVLHQRGIQALFAVSCWDKKFLYDLSLYSDLQRGLDNELRGEYVTDGKYIFCYAEMDTESGKAQTIHSIWIELIGGARVKF